VTTYLHPVSFFTGKGGVGKSTVVASVAVAAAAAGKRPLVVELGHRASMQTLFGTPLEYEPSELAPNVHGAHLELEDALVDYVAAQVKLRALARRIVGSDALRRFFHAAPAVAEITALRRLRVFEEAGWDPILVDLDATGHALMFLSLPEVFRGLAKSGPIRALLDGFTAMLRDPARSVLHVVTLPSELPAQETKELVETLRAREAIALGRLVVNRVPKPPLPPHLVAALEDAPDSPDVLLARRAIGMHARALAITRSLEDLGLPVDTLPELEDPDGPDVLETLGAALLSEAA